MVKSKICPECKNEFTPKHPDHIFCDDCKEQFSDNYKKHIKKKYLKQKDVERGGLDKWIV